MTAPTPENVAESLTSDDNVYHDGYEWTPSLTADGNVLRIGITPTDADGEDCDEVHFRAVVVPGEQVPLILNRDQYAEEINSRVEWLVMALAHAPREDYPIHFAEFRESLIALADQAADPASLGSPS